MQSKNLPNNNNISAKVAIKEISFCWIFGIIFGVGHFISHSDLWFQIYIIIRLIFLIIVPIVILGINYFRIYEIILNQISNERKVKELFFVINDQSINEKLLRREARATVNILLIIIIFMITWIPLHIILAIKAFDEDSISQFVLAITILIAQTNSAIHPFLYAYRMKDIRQVIFKLLNFRGSATKIDVSSSSKSKFYIS